MGTGAVVLATGFWCGPAMAQQSEEQPKQEFEKPDVQELQQQIDDLKAQDDELSDTAADDEADMSESQRSFDLTWEPGPVLTSKDGKFSFELNARVS